jgi:hypothetical protein
MYKYFFKGQGVVLERSVFSDSVIGQSLFENNLMSDQGNFIFDNLFYNILIFFNDKSF